MINGQNDLWAALDAELQENAIKAAEHEYTKSKIVNKVMETFELFRTIVIDYIPIAKSYCVKPVEYCYNKQFFLGYKKVVLRLYPLSVYLDGEEYPSEYDIYLSESHELYLSKCYRGLFEKFKEKDIIEIKEQVDKTISSFDPFTCEYGSWHKDFPKGSNYIYGNIGEALVRLTYHFSKGPSHNCVFRWDMPRSENEIRELMQAFFIEMIRKDQTKY